MKKCSKCEKELPEEKFCKSTKTRSGLQSWCKDCVNSYNKLAYKRFSPEKIAGIRLRETRRLRAKVAGGGCWTCSKPASEGRKYCAECLIRHAAKTKRRAHARVANGICRECGKNQISEKSKGYCDGCLLGRRLFWQRLKMDAFMAYGGPKCVCCGVSEPMFLNIDHVNRNGAAHIREIGKSAGFRIYGWLKRHRYPAGFQVLCFNCNCAREFNGGICPHQQQQAA